MKGIPIEKCTDCYSLQALYLLGSPLACRYLCLKLNILIDIDKPIADNCPLPDIKE